MPLVVIVGLPSSGKTTRAKQIKEQLGIELTTGVYHISENDILQYMGLSKNAVYMGKLFYYSFVGWYNP